MAAGSVKPARKTRRVLYVFLITLLGFVLACILVCGAAGYLYYSTDATAVPAPDVTLNGIALQPQAVTWNTPVLPGLWYKGFNRSFGVAQTLQGAITSAQLTLAAPADMQMEFTLTQQDGTAVPVQVEARGAAASLCSGTYAYRLVLTAPRQGKKAYGSFTYTGQFAVALEPVVQFSAAQVPQGGVLLVGVSGMEGETPPVLQPPFESTAFARAGNQWVAALGLGYKTQAGEYTVTVQCNATAVSHTFTVTQTDFAKQYMTIDTGVANATANNEAANKEWRDAIYPLYDTADDTIYWQGRFQDPLEQRIINTEYGLFRYTNGSSVAERHGGIDLDGETGDAVHATAAGRVVLAQFLALTGNTVVVEHGGGLKSYYFHMNTLACAPQDKVSAGQTIGTVGSTGYSTGAHLHFELKLGRQSIDPIALLDGTSGLYFTA